MSSNQNITSKKFIHLLREEIPHPIKRKIQIAGFITILSDIAVFELLKNFKIQTDLLYIISFFIAILINFFLSLKIYKPADSGVVKLFRSLKWLAIFLLAFALRYAMLAFCLHWNCSHTIAILPVSIITTIVLYFGNLFFIFWDEQNPTKVDLRWKIATLGILVYLTVTRLLYMGVLELEYHEAYYWTYSQRIDIGYFDHPPMVAWLNFISTLILGNTEFAIRLSAVFCYIVLNLFVFLLTKDIFDRTTAYRALILLNVLRPFFDNSFEMTTDAPLMPCWAGVLYFLHLVFFREKRWAWLGVGICIGLGMLSKYTISLLGFSILIFMLLDKQSRKWFFRFEPYVAFVVALLILLPIVIWNMQNEWVSFTFQAKSRLSHFYGIYFHKLLKIWLKMLTPLGIFAVFLALLPRSYKKVKYASSNYYLFVLTSTLFPLSIFVYQSFLGTPKESWTSPIWLSLIPMMAHQMCVENLVNLGQKTKFILRFWTPTIIGMMLYYSLHWCYFVFGIPCIGYTVRSNHTQRWREISKEVEKIEKKLTLETGQEPLIVGMDEYEITTLLGFYRYQDDTNRPRKSILNTAGQHLFDKETTMYSYWFPIEKQTGKNIIIVASEESDLPQNHLSEYFEKLGPIHAIMEKKEGSLLQEYCYQIGYNYHYPKH